MFMLFTSTKTPQDSKNWNVNNDPSEWQDVFVKMLIFKFVVRAMAAVKG